MRPSAILKNKTKYFLRMIPTRPQGILGLQLLGIVCSSCRSISCLRGFWGSSCRVLSVIFCVSISGLGAPAVEYCLFFLYVNFGPRGILELQLSGIICLFLCQFWASGDSRAPAVGYCLVVFLRISALRGFWGSGCRVLFVILICQSRASGDSGAPAVGYCLFFLSVDFGPQRILGLQLSGIVCSFCVSFSGLRGF